ncbi:hypothetical protein RYR54_004312, partial [Aeromonas sobria]|nr:hypothetical protein [Aeromonas sobria]
VFASFAHGNEPYGLDALKAIVNIDASDANNDREGAYNLNYTFDTNGGFVIFTKIDDYEKSKCYLQYAPDKHHNLIDDLPDGEYFQIVTSGC